MRIALLAIAILALAASGCSTRDPHNDYERIRASVAAKLASDPSLATNTYGDVNAIIRIAAQSARAEQFALELADPADPAVAAALRDVATRLGALEALWQAVSH